MLRIASQFSLAINSLNFAVPFDVNFIYSCASHAKVAGLLIDPFLSYLVHERFELGLVDLGDLEGEEADGGGLADLAALGRGGHAARHHVQGLEAAEKKMSK